ncbi:MAG: sugar phosphate nucleotidyltransferase [Dehalococcoidia bacterium]|nr:sugar phosphate nucleotidyltransferase [Dehalococcoidia bacterium]
MKAVILAAGEGNRMHPLTYTRPKVMLPLANKPIVEHLLLEAREAGIQEFIFVVGYHGDTVRRFFGNGDRWKVSIEYVTQRKQLGTTHALRVVERFIDGKFLLINGDVIVGGEYIRKIAAKNEISLSLVEVTNPWGLGVVEVEEGHVVRIYEKVANPPSNLANAGLYLLTTDIFAAASGVKKSPRGEYELTDSLQLLIDEQHRVSYEIIDNWLDLSYPWDLLAGNEALMSRVIPQNLGLVEENAVIKGMVSIGKGTVIRANSYIIGPVVIGENCEIGPNCYIRPSTSIGDNCHIGSSVEVKNSIIMGDSKVPHHNYVGDSVIGEGCNLGAGTKIANLRLDKKEITAMGINTGRHKLGAILGDGVQTGINACIDVGSLLGNGTYIGAGALASGVIAPNSRIYG